MLLFTIIIPTYNRRWLLQQAIESVVRQTWQEWQLLVVDDGSTDETPTYLNTLSDARIQVIRQANTGRGAVRNAGIPHANGQYILFLDDDDLFRPDHLATLATAHQNRTAGNHTILYTGGWFEQNERRTALNFTFRPNEPFEKGLKRLWQQGSNLAFYAFPVSVFSSMAEASMPTGLRFDARYHFGEDLDVLVHASLQVSVSGVGKRTVVLRSHGQRWSQTPGAEVLLRAEESRIPITQNLIPKLKNHLPDRILYGRLHQDYLFLANWQAKMGYTRKAWQSLRKAWVYPSHRSSAWETMKIIGWMLYFTSLHSETTSGKAPLQ